jgi:hypothetical protein
MPNNKYYRSDIDTGVVRKLLVEEGYKVKRVLVSIQVVVQTRKKKESLPNV